MVQRAVNEGALRMGDSGQMEATNAIDTNPKQSKI